jgi:hypothetical protein
MEKGRVMANACRAHTREKATATRLPLGKGMGFAALSVLCATGPVHADGARDFNADTPGKAYTPYTVAQGYYQIESDSFHITEQDGTQTIEFLDPVFKYGLGHSVEIDLQTNGFSDITSAQKGKTTHVFGYGDITPSFKWNLVGDDSQDFSAAFKFGVKMPTASPGIGNGAIEYYAILPAQIGLPADFSLQVQEEIDVLRNQNDTGKHFSYAEDVSLSKSLGKMTFSTEMFAQSGTDPNNQALYTADVGISYQVTPVVVVTFGTYFGLNRYAPSVEGFTGFGFRF